jgi:hypothetical protein
MARYLLLALLLATVAGCGTSRKEVMASGSQVEVRSYQTRTYDTDNKIRVLRAVMATLQDLGFVIDKADDVIGVVSATKLQGYALSMSISVRPNGQQMTVRANAQYNLMAVEDPEPYQDFFASLDKGLFLEDNLYAASVPTQTPAENSSTGEATGAIAYYGEAEQEITDKTYDKNLWAQAYVEVEGDEQKRKAKYIELRANQLYATSAGSKPVVSQSIRPVVSTQAAARQKSAGAKPIEANNSISGTYVSDITTNTHWVFDKAKHRKLVVRFEQNGNSIIGTSSSANLKLVATREGDDITFYTLPSDVSSDEIKGKWKVSADGSRIEGKWTHPHGDGKWNLTRIDSMPIATAGSRSSGSFGQSEPPTYFDISGAYISDRIDANWTLKQQRRLRIKLKQNQNSLDGNFFEGLSGPIRGAISGDKFEFTWEAGNCTLARVRCQSVGMHLLCKALWSVVRKECKNMR